MFLIDDILSYPVTGILSLFQELHNAAKQEAAGAADALRAELSDLYLRLEAGQLTEAEFDAREGGLLDQLDALEADDPDEDEDEGDDEDEFAEDADEDEDEDEYEESLDPDAVVAESQS